MPFQPVPAQEQKQVIGPPKQGKTDNGLHVERRQDLQKTRNNEKNTMTIRAQQTLKS